MILNSEFKNFFDDNEGSRNSTEDVKKKQRKFNLLHFPLNFQFQHRSTNNCVFYISKQLFFILHFGVLQQMA